MRFSIVLLVAAAALGLTAVAGAEQGYTDATGDSGQAPDLGQVVVSNDATTVLFDIAVRPGLPEPDDLYVLMIDSDANVATGDDGADVQVYSMGGAGNVEVWNGSAWVDAPPDGISIRLEASHDRSKLLVSVPRTLLGNTTAFRFVVISGRLSGEEVVGTDVAPDGTAWRYELGFTQCANGRDDDADGKVDALDLGCAGVADDLESDDPYTLAIVRPTAKPAVARTGKPITVKARVTQVETAKPITTGTVRCTAKVGARTKRWAGQLVSGTAMCRLIAPKVARPTTVRGTIIVRSKATSISAPFSVRVR